MIVYLIHVDKLYNLTLPKVVNGNYILKDEDKGGNERSLLNIVAKDGKWVINSNKKIEIYEDDLFKQEIYLREYKSYIIKLKNSDESVILYVCPVMDRLFTCFKVNKSQTLSIGSEQGSAIRYDNPVIAPNHALLGYNNGWIIKDMGSLYGTYVNNERISAETYLHNGDVIFILGLKIIIIDDKVWVNNPNEKVFMMGNIFQAYNVPDNNIAEEYIERENIKLYESNEYFSKVSSFSESVETAHFILDDAPKISKPDETPALLTIGPMLTMSMTSISTFILAILNYQNNGNKSSIISMGIMSVSMLLGTLLWPILTRKYEKRKYERNKNKLDVKYNDYLTKKDGELNRIATNQKQILLSNNISSIDAYNMALSKGQNLWKRDLHQNGFLNIRLGIGKVPLKLDYTFPEEHFSEEDEEAVFLKINVMLEKYKNIEEAPIVESLVDNNIVSIIGKHDLAKSFVDKMLLQILFLHSYFDLKLVLFTDSKHENKWEYLKKAPHLFSSNKDIRFFAANDDDSKDISQYLLNIINSRIPEDNKEDLELYKNFDEYYLIITDNYENVKDFPLFENILKTKSNIGVSIIILNNSFANLPVECHKFIGINSETEGGLIDSDLSLENQKIFAIEGTPNVDYDAFCTSLANVPIAGKKAAFKLPKIYNFLEMYESGNVEQLNALERWRYNDPVVSLGVPVGINSIGNKFKLDLHEKAHGPHGLIAGMTGSGKSDFIISYILSLSINFHPEEVQFVLIDYKGGGLVGAFSNKEAGYRLPHLAGTITNLEKAEIDRSMAAIQTELERRQALFNQAKEKLSEGTIDIYKYQKYHREGLIDTPLSHLFIISDEFAELKSQEPEFMDLLISTARIGRSLGVHLILATQKPSGVVNDQIWSNARFKVCLKVQDASDSNEVIKRPDAAYLKEAGRFYLQVGYNELFDIGQAAYSEGSYIPKEEMHVDIDDDIDFIDNVGKIIKTINFQKNTQDKVEGEELTNIVKYLSDLSVRENIVTRPLWLEPLPKVLYYNDIINTYNYSKPVNQIEAVIGVYDNPNNQSQDLLKLEFTKIGNAVIYSTNERNTIMDTIIYSLISNYSPKELNIYGLDLDSQTLKAFSSAPQVGDILFVEETDKIEQLFRKIYDELEKRKKLLQEYNGSYEYYLNNSGSSMPALLFIIHGFESFKENFEDQVSDVEKITREGARYGIYTLITAVTDSSLRMNLKNNLPQIVPLKLNTQMDYNVLLGKKAPVIMECDNRGAIAKEDGIFEFQTASISPEENRKDTINEKINMLNSNITERVSSIKILPEHVSFSDTEIEPLKFNRIPIGLEEKSLEVSYIDITKSFITSVVAQTDDCLGNMAKVLYKQFSKFKGLDLMIYDMNEYIGVTSSSMEDMSKLFSPDRKNIAVIVVTGVTKWLDTFDDETKKDIKGYFDRIAALKNTIFIFIDKAQEIKSLVYEDWFKRYVPKDKGIYIGKGLGDFTYFSLSNSYKDLNGVIPDNFGFNIINGIAAKIKVIEVDVDGE